MQTVLWQRRVFLWLAGAVLAVHPAIWLANSWVDPAYGSDGAWIAACVVTLGVWSCGSRRVCRRGGDEHRLALGVLVVTTAVRIASQVLGVDVLGALALVGDVFALATLAGVHQRRRALSPGWLAALFAFSLPLDRIVQRTLGYALQHLSAQTVCHVLGAITDSVTCSGVDLNLAGTSVLVDLPCSGARGMVALLTLLCGAAALVRPRGWPAVVAVVVAVVAAWASNVVRIIILAVGIAWPGVVGVDVMGSPWHDLIGLISILVGALLIAAWLRQCPRGSAVAPDVPSPCSAPDPPRRPWLDPLLFALSWGVLALPGRPVDVTSVRAAPQLPTRIAGQLATPLPLLAQEQAYFTQYGGGAARAQYGAMVLLVVETSAPLRHLHAPDECLAGAGHEVHYVGMRRSAGVAAAEYRSIDPQGRAWRVLVNFVSSDGLVATSVAEAVFRWLQDRTGTWMMVQRITPWELSAGQMGAYERAVVGVLDLSTTKKEQL